MDDFLSHLDVSPKADIDQLLSQFSRILSWLHIDPLSEPDLPQVRILLRAVLFLYGNLAIHGQTLEQKLNEYRLIPKNELNTLLEKFHAGTLLSDVCEQLLMTVSGPDHIIEIQDFCQDFLDTNQLTNIIAKARELRHSKRAEDRVTTEAKFLIITTFRLKSAEDIDLAVQKIVDNVEFDVLAWIINMKEPLTYFAIKCLIVQKELCSRLESGLVSRKTIASMYEVCALNEDGFSIYLKCLQNPMFASSLMIFFLSYLSAIAEDSPSEVHQEHKLKEHDINYMSFLIAGMMSKKSDCRIEFHKKLADVSVSVNVLLSIRHLNFVYDL